MKHRTRIVLLALLALAGCESAPPSAPPPGAPAVELASTQAAPGYVRLEWVVRNPPAAALELQRRHADDPWKFRAWLTATPAGRLVFEDATVSPGESYSWRIRLPNQTPEYQGTVTILVPG